MMFFPRSQILSRSRNCLFRLRKTPIKSENQCIRLSIFFLKLQYYTVHILSKDQSLIYRLKSRCFVLNQQFQLSKNLQA